MRCFVENIESCESNPAHFAEYHNLRNIQLTMNNILHCQINSVNENFLELSGNNSNTANYRRFTEINSYNCSEDTPFAIILC